MSPTPTGEQLAVARRVGRRLSSKLPESGVIDYEDVASMAVEAVVRLVAEGKAPEDEALFYTAVLRRTIDILRSEGVLTRKRSEDEDDHYERGETPTEIQTLGVGDLEPQAREVMRLSYEEDMAPAEIARRTGRTRGSIYVVRGRALRALRGDTTDRELEVMAYAASGLTTAETAAKMFLSEDTIKCHRKGAMASLCARSMTQAVAIAFRRGLLV